MRGRAAQRGQAIVLAALFFVVLTGIAGLVMDGGHDYLVKRQAQAAADFAALGAGKQLALNNSFLTGAPKANDKSIIAAHDYAAANGFNTTYSNSCDVSTSSSFTTSWFDVSGLACSATNGFNTKITVNAPAVAMGGVPIPSQCTGSTQYNCIQVVVSARVTHWFMASVGIPFAYVTTFATVFAHPPGTNFNVPPPQAVYLYEPADDCVGQCFDTTKAPLRQQMTCNTSIVANANCPTFWINSGSAPLIAGVDGNVVNPAGDQVALEAAGHTVVQDSATICDPFGGKTCSAGTALGSKGFARGNSAKVYCSTVSGSLYGTGCTTTGQSGLKTMYTNETGYFTSSWSPSVDTSTLYHCGALVLNGDNIKNSYVAQGSLAPTDTACYPPNSEPYTIQPGIYSYIVINHGSYTFQAGVYDITGKAPVNTLSAPGYIADGIDHGAEGAADWDLCTGAQPTSCGGASPLTAGVWIGHGKGGYTAATAGTASKCNFSGGGTPGVQGGGGDPTDVAGNSVSFRFEPGSAGFVSTAEVHSIAMTSPGLGQVSVIGGVPMLFDLENGSFIHLDSKSGGGTSGFSGLIYQNPSYTSGGLELDPGLANKSGAPALVGQVRAWSLTTFGRSGIAVSFKAGYGTSSNPPVTTSGNAENWIIGSASMQAGVNGVSGMETFTLSYQDEWALDAYGLYLKINNGSPIFFSQGIWVPTPPPSAPVPPAVNNPGDSNPAYPSTTQAGAVNYTTATDANGNPDWTIALPNGTANKSLFEVDGNWAWGHESEIPGAVPNWGGSYYGGNYASINFTFPTPPGTTVAIQVFMTDGDFCGDYALANYTFNNIGQPNGGLQSGASVSLVM